MSGFASGRPLLSTLSNVSVGSQGPVCFSIHLSGIVNGFTQVSALAGDASAVAVAVMSTVLTPKNVPINVLTGLVRPAVRNTVTATRVGWPDGSFGKVPSA